MSDEITVTEEAPAGVEQAAEEKFKTLDNDPYTYEGCVISANISWLPSDENPAGRQIVVSVRNHLEAPIFRFYTESTLPFENILDVLGEMLQELREALPERQVAKLQEQANKTKKKPSSLSGRVISTSTPLKITKVGGKTVTTPIAQKSLF